MSHQTTIGVVGAGSWGTALAVLANRAGSKVTLWSRNDIVAQAIDKNRINSAYLPDVFIDPDIAITQSLKEVAHNDILILSIPSQSLRTICIALSDLINPDVPIIISSKGIERGSLALMSEVASSILPLNKIAIISGPNFAKEAALGKPTATTIACEDEVVLDKIAYAIGSKNFRPYISDDVIGTQIGGAVKNIIAIACGIAHGKELGDNARSALITRGLAEINRLNVTKGGKAHTIMGLSGIGDLMLTCSSLQSRNMRLGYNIGKTGDVKAIINDRLTGLTEGVTTTDSVYELSVRLGVAMPICNAMYHILSGDITVDQGISELLERPFKAEV